MERWVEEQGLYAVAVWKILQDMKESLIQSSNIYHLKGVELTKNWFRKDLKGWSDKLMQVSICVPFQKVWYDIHLGQNFYAGVFVRVYLNCKNAWGLLSKTNTLSCAEK